MTSRTVDLRAGEDGSVTAAVHAGDADGIPFLLTHGAGGDRDGPGLVALAQGLAERGHPVVLANLPYREAGRPLPPKAERMLAAFAAIAESARRTVPTDRGWVVGGKSYGGRVASMAVAEGSVPHAIGLVFHGYPLHPPGKPDRPRVDHWPRIAIPCLFLQGTHDTFGGDGILRSHLGQLGGPATVEVVVGGDHSLLVPASRSDDGRRRQEGEVLGGLAERVSTWARALRE